MGQAAAPGTGALAEAEGEGGGAAAEELADGTGGVATDLDRFRIFELSDPGLYR